MGKVKFKINYNLKIQEKNIYCVPSVLQAIFDRHGLNVSQEEIADELTPSENGFRLDDLKFKNFLEDQGFNYDFFHYNTTPFNEPDILLNELGKKDILFGWNNHARLINGFNDPLVDYLDPKDVGFYVSSLFKIREKMIEGGDGFFGLIGKFK